MSTETVEVIANPEGFSYVDLNEVDPTFQSLPTDFYKLRVKKAELKTFPYRQTTEYHKAGDLGEMVKFQLIVVDHPEFAGRYLFEVLFSGKQALRAMRLLMDATGVKQTPGSALEDWLKQLSEVQPEFRVKVEQKEDLDKNGSPKSINPKTGKPALVNVVKWNEVIPV